MEDPTAEPLKKLEPLKKAALSHIPFDILLSMEKQTAISSADLAALQDTVLKKGPAIRASVPGAVPTSQSMVAPSTLPSQAASMSYAIDGHVINLPMDRTGAGIELFYMLLAFVWSRDKNVAKILKKVDFKFYDANNVQIFPKLKKNARK